MTEFLNCKSAKAILVAPWYASFLQLIIGTWQPGLLLDLNLFLRLDDHLLFLDPWLELGLWLRLALQLLCWQTFMQFVSLFSSEVNSVIVLPSVFLSLWPISICILAGTLVVSTWSCVHSSVGILDSTAFSSLYTTSVIVGMMRWAPRTVDGFPEKYYCMHRRNVLFPRWPHPHPRHCSSHSGAVTGPLSGSMGASSKLAGVVF